MTQVANKYQEQKEARIQSALDTMVIESDSFGTYATVPSTSNKNNSYIVNIDESERIPVATDCNCKGNAEFGHTCVHMQAVDRLFTRVCARPVVTVGEAITAANEDVRATIEAVAVAGDRSYNEAVGYSEMINPRTGMTDKKYQEYQNYLMQIGA